jgi:hypothetical protein
VRLDPAATGAAQLTYGSYLGGSGTDGASDVIVDLGGAVYVVGATTSQDFPALDALQPHQGGNDAFVTRLDPTDTGSDQLRFSTFLGGCGEDSARRVELDAAGDVYVVGTTRSGSFPTAPGVFQSAYAGGGDGYVAKISGSGPTLPVDPSCPDDGNACNGVASCDPATGNCISGPPVVCADDGDPCNGAESCDPESGECISGPPAADGTPCDDGDPLTCGDSCGAGVCAGTVEPDEIDDSVRLSGPPQNTSIAWTDAPGPYHVYRGSLAPASSWAYNHLCFDDPAGPSTADTSIPSAGELYWYLVSREDACGESPLGRDSAGQEIPNDDPCTP